MTKNTPLLYTFGILKDTKPELATMKNLDDRLDPGVYSCSAFPSDKQILLTTLEGMENDEVYARQQAELNEILNERAGASVIPMRKEERVARAKEIRIELGLPPISEVGAITLLGGE